MTTLRASDILHILRNGRSKHDFTALVIDDSSFYIAMDSNGYATLLADVQSDRPSQQFRTDLVSLRLGVNCTLNLDGEIVEKRLHILQCLSHDQDLVLSFLTLSIALAQQFNNVGNLDQVLETYFGSLIELFRTTAESNSRQARQGLWGELFLIRYLNGVIDLMNFWHSDPSLTFDFSAKSKKLEVKTTSSFERIHGFSHHQLHQRGGDEIVIASLLLMPDDSGLTLRQLIDQCREHVKNDYDLLVKLEKSVRRVGMAPEAEIGPAFSEAYAIDNLAWFQAEKVPRFPQAEPAGVSGTHYKVDLSSVSPTPETEVQHWLQTWEKTNDSA